MPRPHVDRDAIADYVNGYVDTHDKRPGTREIASHFECSPQTAQAALAGLDARGMLLGKPLRPGARTDRRLECLRAIRSYQLTHTWAPSQREIAEMLGTGLHRVNAILEELAGEGRIVMGSAPRQLYLTDTTIDIPEVVG